MNSTRPSLLVQAPEDRLFYVESSIPPGLTLDGYRRARTRPARRGSRVKLRRRSQ
jgi:hypothetical protein